MIPKTPEEIQRIATQVIDEEKKAVENLKDRLNNGFFEAVCPSCGGVIYFDEDMLDNEDGLICPHCNEPVDIDIFCGDDPEEEED